MTFNPVQVPTVFLIEQIGTTEDFIKVAALKDHRGNDLSMEDFGDIAYITVSPGKSNEEIMSISDIIHTSDGKVKLVISERGLLPKPPYTVDSSYRKEHSSGAAVSFSNTPQFYDEFAKRGEHQDFSGNNTFTGNNTFSGELKSTGPQNEPSDVVSRGTMEAYVNALETGSESLLDLDAVAAENLAGLSCVYFRGNHVYKTSRNEPYIQTDNVIIGILAKNNAVVAGQDITDGIVTIGETLLTGFTPGETVYVGSNGNVTTNSIENAIKIGFVDNAGTVHLNGTAVKKNYLDAQVGNSNTSPSVSNKYQTEESDIFRKLVDDEEISVPLTGNLVTQYQTILTAGGLEIYDGTALKGNASSNTKSFSIIEDVTDLRLKHSRLDTDYSVVSAGGTAITIPAGDYVHASAISPDGRYLYIALTDPSDDDDAVIQKYEFATPNDFSSALTLVDGNIYTITNTRITGMDCKNNGTDNVIFITYNGSGTNSNFLRAVIDSSGGANTNVVNLNTIGDGNYKLQQISVSDDGVHMIALIRGPFYTGTSNDDRYYLVHHTMTTAFDVSTLSIASTTNRSTFSYAIVSDSSIPIATKFGTGTTCETIAGLRKYIIPTNYRVDQSTTVILTGEVGRGGSVEDLGTYYNFKAIANTGRIYKTTNKAVGTSFINIRKIK